MSLQSVMFQCPEELLDELEEAASKAKTSKAQIIREALAAHLEFDLGTIQKTGRPKKYASEAERKAAQYGRNKLRRQAANDLMKRYNDALKAGDIKAMEDWLKEQVEAHKVVEAESEEPVLSE